MLAGLLLSFAALGGPGQAITATSIAVTAPAPPSREVVALLDAMRPRQAAIDAEIAAFDAAVPSLLAAQKEEGETDAEQSGDNEKIMQATRKVLVEFAPRNEDKLRGRLAAILQNGLTAAQVSELTDFYHSSVGLAIVEQMHGAAGQSGGEHLAEALKNEKLQQSHVDKMRMDAARQVRLTGLQQAALLRFMETPTWQALQKLQPRLTKAQVDFANEPDPAFDAALEAASEKVLTEVAGAGK